MFGCRLVPLLFVLPMVACNPQSAGSGDGPGSSSGASATDDGTTAPVLACDDYRSATEVGPAVTVTVRNDAFIPQYFVPINCGGAIPIDVAAMPGEIEVPHRLGECAPILCDDFLGSPDCGQACPNCLPPGAARIEPGGTIDGTWSGGWLVPLQMTHDCADGSNCQATCQRQDAAPAGRYRIGLTIMNTCVGGCECEEPATDGVCNLYSGVQLGYPQTFIVDIDYPEQTTAELVIVD